MIGKKRIQEIGRLKIYLSIPFIYIMIIPLVITHIFLEVYHMICFRLYGIPLVKRSNYIKFDRYKLNYLNFIDKLNCEYCSYANGLINYTSKIAADTEKYWCPIKHELNKNFHSPKHHDKFIKFGDKKSFEKKFKV